MQASEGSSGDPKTGVLKIAHPVVGYGGVTALFGGKFHWGAQK